MSRQLFSIYLNDPNHVIYTSWTVDEFFSAFSPEYNTHDWGFSLDINECEYYFNELDAKKRILGLLENSIQIADEDIEECFSEIQEIKQIKEDLITKKLKLQKEIENES